MAALVCIRVIWLPSTVMSRFRAETMPSVTVPPRVPMGLPTAMTTSPTCTLSESPSTAGVRPVASIFSRAMSLCWSLPTTVAV